MSGIDDNRAGGDPALWPRDRRAFAPPGEARAVVLAALSLCALGLGAFVEPRLERLLAFSVSGSLACLAVWFFALRRWRPLRGAWIRSRLADLVDNDPAPCLATDGAGGILYVNGAAKARFATESGQAAAAFAALFAAPEAVIARLRARAEAGGAAREDIVTRRGHLRLTVHRLGPQGFLWRLDDLGGVLSEDGAQLPRLILSQSGAVLGMNAALRALVGERLRSLDQIVTDLPLRPGEEHEIVTPEGLLRCFVAETRSAGGRREVFFLPISADKARSHDPTAFDSLPMALARLDAEGRILEANQEGRKLLATAAAPGTRLSDVFEGLGRAVSDWVRDARGGRSDRRPEVLRLRGTERYVQVTLNRMVSEGRMGLIAVMSDATQFKTLEAQFVQSQKMQAIGQLAGGVAHDFNNLLTAITGHCDLLMLRHDKSDPDYADIEQIGQNANRAAALVRQLLAFSRKQTMLPQVLDLRDVLSDLTHLLNRLVGERIALAVAHDPDLRAIRADKRQLEQVIMNLVVNARDAMPEGGAIRIETRNLALAEDRMIQRAVVPRGDYVEVSISDDGAGIAPETLPKIFEPFFTTKRTGEGTGLGLSTAYGIVKQTGGYIFCESERGRGARFFILLPSHAAQADEAEQGEAAGARDPIAAPESATGSVLLVEDETAVRAFASRALRLRGYAVAEAANGEEALRLLQDKSLNFDIFVSDVIMPGVDGPTWVSRALQDRPGVPVVFMSGYAEDVFRDGLPRTPHSAFLAKPFSLGDLTSAVRDTLAR